MFTDLRSKEKSEILKGNWIIEERDKRDSKADEMKLNEYKILFTL